MAHMYPVGGPTKATTSDAERLIYDLLGTSLDDTYHVFHSAHWTLSEEDGRVANGEIDFIIVHQDQGILLFEVKGGGVYYDPAAKQWFSRNRYAQQKDIKDPFLQGSTSAHTLKRHLTKRAQTKPYARQYWINYGVWLPGITWTPGGIPLMHVMDELVLDAQALPDPAHAIASLFERTQPKKRRSMSPEALHALLDVLAPKRAIPALLSDRVIAEEQRFIQLQRDQYRKLDMMSHFPRVAVRGAAGTGKTVLAMEKARQLAASELEVLFVCANPSLAQWLNSTADREPTDIREHIHVHFIEELCVQLSGQAGLTINDVDEDELAAHEELGPRTEQNKLGSLFLRSVNKLEQNNRLPRYDAILVDEAQDIERPLWTPLHKLLRERRNGHVLAFYDPAQREDGADWTPPIAGGARELVLTENCRNTQAIFAFAQQFYLGMEPPKCVGPTGDPVLCYDPAAHVPQDTPPDELDTVALEQVLDHLVDVQRIAPQDILVITCRSQRSSALYTRRSVGKHLLDNHVAFRDPRFVRITTVRSAKGLESPVIILAELDGLQRMRTSNPARYSHYLYIATSRAKNHLVVLASHEHVKPLQPALMPLPADHQHHTP